MARKWSSVRGFVRGRIWSLGLASFHRGCSRLCHTAKARNKPDAARIDESWGSLTWVAGGKIGNAAEQTVGRVTIKAVDTGLTFRPKSNYLYEGNRRVAFVTSIYRPKVLCRDPNAGQIWLTTYSGVAWVRLPSKGGK